jgi:hypothetical protein
MTCWAGFPRGWWVPLLSFDDDDALSLYAARSHLVRILATVDHQGEAGVRWAVVVMGSCGC